MSSLGSTTSFASEGEILRVHQCIRDLSDRATRAEAAAAHYEQLVQKLRARSLQIEVIAMLVGAENARYEGFLEGYLSPLLREREALFAAERSANKEEFQRYRSYARQRELKLKREGDALRRENEALKAAMETTANGRRMLADVGTRLGGFVGDRGGIGDDDHQHHYQHRSRSGGASSSVTARASSNHHTNPIVRGSSSSRLYGHNKSPGQSRSAGNAAYGATTTRGGGGGVQQRSRFDEEDEDASTIADDGTDADSLVGDGGGAGGRDAFAALLGGGARSQSGGSVDASKNTFFNGGEGVLRVPTTTTSSRHYHADANNQQQAMLLAQFLGDRDNRIAQLERDNAKLLKDVTSSMLLK